MFAEIKYEQIIFILRAGKLDRLIRPVFKSRNRTAVLIVQRDPQARKRLHIRRDVFEIFANVHRVAVKPRRLFFTEADLFLQQRAFCRLFRFHVGAVRRFHVVITRFDRVFANVHDAAAIIRRAVRYYVFFAVHIISETHETAVDIFPQNIDDTAAYLPILFDKIIHDRKLIFVKFFDHIRHDLRLVFRRVFIVRRNQSFGQDQHFIIFRFVYDRRAEPNTERTVFFRQTHRRTVFHSEHGFYCGNFRYGKRRTRKARRANGNKGKGQQRFFHLFIHFSFSSTQFLNVPSAFNASFSQSYTSSTVEVRTTSWGWKFFIKIPGVS